MGFGNRIGISSYQPVNIIQGGASGGTSDFRITTIGDTRIDAIGNIRITAGV